MSASPPQWRVWQYRASRRLGRLVTWLAAIATLGRMPPFVSASAIVQDGDRLLVVEDPVRREPVLPGGHLKWRETPRQAVVREVREETGYTISPQEVLVVEAGEEWTGEPGVVRVVYTATIIGGQLTGSAEGDAHWLPISELLVTGRRDARLVQRWLDSRTPLASGR